MDNPKEQPAAVPTQPETATKPPEQTTPPAATVATIQYDDFAKIQLRVATILSAEPLEKSKKLLKLKVNLGDEERQVLAGIKEHYSPDSIVGKQIIIVANLAPRDMMGTTSHGMLLAATDSATGKVILLSPSEPVGPGSGVK